jgi:hypothetical protein
VTATPGPTASSRARLIPNLTTRLYDYQDENTVDIYLSDLPEAMLAQPWTAQSRPDGQIIHIRMFIRPEPGRTPIDPNALNAVIRHVILAPGATGMYSGGGFLLPTSQAASGQFSGTIAAGTMRLDSNSPGFNDALGPAELRAAFRLRRDPELAAQIDRRLGEMWPNGPDQPAGE